LYTSCMLRGAFTLTYQNKIKLGGTSLSPLNHHVLCNVDPKLSKVAM
jgi:hypothetical protein